MVSRVLVVHLSSLFTATTSMSWDFHCIIFAFKLESCTLIKSADKTKDILSAGPKHISLRATIIVPPWQNGQRRRKRRRPYSLHSAKFYICSMQEMHVQCMQINFMRSWLCKLCKEQKILQKSGLHEAPPEQEFEENCGIFSAWDNPPPLLFGLSQLAPYLETTFILHLWRV